MKKVSVVPFYNSQCNNIFFSSNSEINRDGALEPYIVLKNEMTKRNIRMETYDLLSTSEADIILLFSLNIKEIFLSILFRRKSIYIAFEPPVVDPLHSEMSLCKLSAMFTEILTWNDNLAGYGNFKKFYFPIGTVKNRTKLMSVRKLLTNISGNKTSKYSDELYSKRVEAIRYFEKNAIAEFDLYGSGWKREEFPSYKGCIENKHEILTQYKFSLCYENMCNINGLISEKIFDCFYAKCIPIFWGAENIQDYIPEQCYIDKRKFQTYDELYAYLKNMTESEYSERIIAIEKYLTSDAFKKFLPHYFAETVYNSLIEDPCQSRYISAILSFIYLLAFKISRYGVRKINAIIKCFKDFPEFFKKEKTV